MVRRRPVQSLPVNWLVQAGLYARYRVQGTWKGITVVQAQGTSPTSATDGDHQTAPFGLSAVMLDICTPSMDAGIATADMQTGPS